jgi:hypothetical protein
VGTAGLDVDRLARLLERGKIHCELVEGDHAYDHCLLRVSSVRCPEAMAYLEYINQGTEPRTLTIQFDRADSKQRRLDEQSGSYFTLTETLRLKGARRYDPDRITQLVERMLIQK